MGESKTYTGGCHCGEVRFEVTADVSNVTACNCSICQKRGALWTFVPAGHFALRAGSGYHKGFAAALDCSLCASSVLFQRMNQEAITVRGARVNNLKNVDFSIPIERLTMANTIPHRIKIPTAAALAISHSERPRTRTMNAPRHAS